MDLLEQPPAAGRIDAPVQEDDTRLVAAILRKDRKATAEFVGRCANAVYGYVRSRLIPRLDLVDDLVQETFLAAWGNLAQYRGASPIEAWLLGIARHKVENYYRSRLREPEPIEETSRPTSPIAVEPEFDELLDSERLRARVRRVLERLPEPYSLALLWRYWEKRSTLEMAAQAGKTEKAIERLLARAREQFRQRWQSE